MANMAKVVKVVNVCGDGERNIFADLAQRG
jgi:hypothetical protein